MHTKQTASAMLVAALLMASANVFAQEGEYALPPSEPEESSDSVTVGKIWESTAAPAETAAEAPKVTPLPDGQMPAAVFDRGLLVDLRGHTLYVFDGDRKPGYSTCFGVCETLWPPHLAPVDATGQGDFTLVRRRDGSVQWGYKGRALYRWARDRKPGDVTGDEVNKVWHVVREGDTTATPESEGTRR